MRPKIICHMMSSIDGRLLCSRWTPLADGDPFDVMYQEYERIAASLNTDGWIVGRKSMESFATGVAHSSQAHIRYPRETYLGNRGQRQLAIAIDPDGKLHYDGSGTRTEHFVQILRESISDDYLAELREKDISYLFAGESGSDINTALETLNEKFGVNTLLLEGGGITNGIFLRAGWIDEISLLIYPGIDGLAGVPSIFEYFGEHDELPAFGKALRLFHVEALENGLVWLRYTVESR